MSDPFPTDAQSRAAELMARCDILAGCTEVPGEITRTYATLALREAMSLAAGWMAEAGMTVREDAVGNLIGRYEADPSIPDPKTFLIGGHLDSVRNAGRYDGILGVLTGIAVVQRLVVEERRLPFAVEVIAFADEEGTRFHTLYLGSGVYTGTYAPDTALMTDRDGVSMAEAMRAYGLDPDRLADTRRESPDLLGFVEVHIEQGPVLEARDLPVGAVTAIVGSSRATVTYTGVAGHAGTVPMALRHDALGAAAEFVLAVESIARETEGLVGTIGQFFVQPGAANVIPGRVEHTLDVRHQDNAVRLAAFTQMRESLAAIGERRGVLTEWTESTGSMTVACDAGLMARLSTAIGESGHEAIALPSGAGHDASSLSALTPVSMLFVRCKGGVSHNPAESIVAADVAVAIGVMDRFVDGIAITVAMDPLQDA